MSRQIDEDVHFRVLRALADNPELSQRDLARQLGVSLGLVNFCLKGLTEKGLIKVRNFRASGRKLRYAYVLTPQALADKARITRRYLARRVAEFDALRAEIEALERDLAPARDQGQEP